jgi:S-adenosylmethionine hydrolase
VDPGVGTQRRPIAIRTGGHFFVGPDNGLFTLILERPETESWPVTAVCLDQPQYWLKDVSRVFHGRDIFSPVAAHLASGVPIEKLGAPIQDPLRLEMPHPQRTASGWRGQVIGIDHFGNLLTNLTRRELDGLPGELSVECAGQTIRGLAATFGARPAGELIALIGTHADLDIAVVNGDAATRLNAQVGDVVLVTQARE